MTFEERLTDTTIKQIDEVTSNIQYLIDHMENLKFEDYERLVNRVRLLQITDFYR